MVTVSCGALVFKYSWSWSCIGKCLYVTKQDAGKHCCCNICHNIKSFEMDTKINDYIIKQSADRQNLLTNIHSVIVEKDKTVVPVVEPMMGKEMIVYKQKGMMKYALSSVKNYMSLHVLPMYGSANLYNKYRERLPKANFQKGCINFVSADEVPLKTLKQLFADCSKIDLQKIREDYLKEKKAKGK